MLTHSIYLIWFSINKFLVDLLKKYVSPIVGLIYGMIILEAHTLCKAAWYTYIKYRQDPKIYGFNTINADHQHRPVLLLHGAVGSWSYLGDLAAALRSAQIPVFVLNHGFGLPTNDIRRKVFDKIEEIRRMTNETSPIDLVAHSNGGNLALYSAFTDQCSSIDSQGTLQFSDEPTAHPHIGKIITIALPSDLTDVNRMDQIKKKKDLFNINAQFDALMGHKTCALSPVQATSINAAHIGIAFERMTYKRVIELLIKEKFRE